MQFINLLKSIYNIIISKLKQINILWLKLREQRYLKYFFLCTPKNIFIFVLMILSFVSIFNTYKEKNTDILYRNRLDSTGITEPIFTESIEFSIYRDEIKQDINIVSLRFATYNRSNDAEYSFTLLKNDKEVYNYKFNSKNIKDFDYTDFETPTIKSSELKNYTVKITPIRTNGENTITLTKNKDTNEIGLSLAHTDSNNINLFLILGFCMIFFIINYFINTKNISMQKYFIVLSIYFFSICLLYPPYEVPDEFFHFTRSLNISQYDFNKAPNTNLSNGNLEFPERGLLDLDYALSQQRDNVNNPSLIPPLLDNKENTIQSIEVIPTNPVGYVIPSFTIKIVDFFSNSPLIIFFSGRIMNMLICIALTYWAIKTAPIYKTAFLFIATMPMILQTLGSYSYDALLNAICLLFISFCLKYIVNKEKVRPVHLSLLFFLLFIIFGIKMPYVLLGILLFFIPNECFKNKTFKYVFIVSGSILTLLSCLLFIKLYTIGVSSSGGDVVSTQSNLQLFLQNPSMIFKIISDTFSTHGEFYLTSLIGYFGYFYFKLDNFFIFAYIAMSITIVLSNSSFISNKQRATLLALFGMISAGIFAALYFAWTPYGSTIIEGVQGRYFIPLLLLLGMAVFPKKELFQIKNTTIYSFINIVILQYIALIIIYYY